MEKGEKLAVFGLVFVLLAPLAQGADRCPGKAKDPVYLACQPQQEQVVCTKNRVINEVRCQDLVPYLMPSPEYPPQQQDLDVEGWVLIGFTVTPEGTVHQPMVINSQPPLVFDEAALGAINLYRFHPPKQPIERVAIRINFSLE